MIEFSMTGASEPSTISMADLVRPQAPGQEVGRLPYYPSYGTITPEQRWVYLNWLRNVDQPIDIGYVFIFYYGLERHLFFGDFEAAFNMILRLRQHHRHPSLLSYSTSALTSACVFHKRPDLFTAVLNDTATGEMERSPDIFLLARWSMRLDLTPKELMQMASKFTFSNRRYLKDEAALFEAELTKLLTERFGASSLPLGRYPIELAPLVQRQLVANISFSGEQRTVRIPCLTEHPGFMAEGKALLQEAHNRVRALLKQAQKNGNSQSTPASASAPKPNKDLSVFAASHLFTAIDVRQFDRNAHCYSHGQCPSCGRTLPKLPAKKGTCLYCLATLIIKNSEFTGESLLLTTQEEEAMVAVRDERIRRNFIKRFIAGCGLSEAIVADAMRAERESAEAVLLDHLRRQGERFKEHGSWGLYRNTLMEAGRLYTHMGHHHDALRHYLIVCWYDLCGASNTGRFEEREVFLAPSVIRMVEQAVKGLDYSQAQVRTLFLECASEYQAPGMRTTPAKAWGDLIEALSAAVQQA